MAILFLDVSPNVRDIKAKINKLDLIKLKCFFTTKEPINKTKQKNNLLEWVCKWND